MRGNFSPNIDFSHIKSENVSISYLRMYLTITAYRDDDITIAHTFILFMMGHLWFQTANDTIPLGYLAAMADLDEAAQYDWGSAILASLYHSLDTAVTTGGTITGFAQLLTVGFVDCEQFMTGEERETYASYWANQTAEVGTLLTDSQRMGNIDMFGPSTLRASITPLVVTSTSIHSLSQDFSLPAEPEGSDLGWHMEWTGRRELLPIHRLRDLPEMSSFYGAEELWHLDSCVNHQLYEHDLQLRRGHDVRVVPLPPGGSAKLRQRGSGL
ncbi:hypothetical protein GIB67_011927 [Kingdonia uniflora]|uniref:Aminotransferase-like plant mobile domain-containing protein n=1 Tax=Kingdonia uniflora TaxID=39325 RepID=A0A7J7LZX7_9MAGN|nr:hypothetical protein GIB67_011927 [Kingdonia uniflora]